MKKSVTLDLKQWDTLDAMMENAIIEIQRSIEGVKRLGHDKAAEILERDLAEYEKLRDFIQQHRSYATERDQVSRAPN